MIPVVCTAAPALGWKIKHEPNKSRVNRWKWWMFTYPWQLTSANGSKTLVLSLVSNLTLMSALLAWPLPLAAETGYGAIMTAKSSTGSAIVLQPLS